VPSNRDYEGVPLVGGMASASNRIGGNALLIDDDFFNVGAVGLALSGAIDVDVIVSQGCRPIGRMMTVTDSQDNAIFSLDGQAPAPLIRELYETMNPSEQKLFQESGIFIGRAMQSIGIAQNGDGSAQPVAYPDELGRGDFLVRAVMGVERETGALVVADQFKVGERVQFQLRDANTAEEDLDMLLVPQSFREAPAGALLFSCNGRGTRLYPHENGDIRIINETFGDIPLAGFFANGELGPVAQNNFLHGHTASLVLFRPKTVD
jgi:small ligand-binding sensory domain FIST